MTIAASAVAERKTFGQQSYRVATRRQSIRLPLTVGQQSVKFDVVDGSKLQAIIKASYMLVLPRLGGFGDPVSS